MHRLSRGAGRVGVAAVLVMALAGCGRSRGAGTSTLPGRRSAASTVTARGPSSIERWQPRPGTTWQWQLTGKIDTDVDAEVFDVDGFEVSAATVAALHDKGRKVICYVDIGAVESYRADALEFPERVIGRAVDGWPDERYLDIRRIDLIGPTLRRRFEMCRDKGFDGIEGDLVDAYANPSGFPIDAHDEVRFIRWFAKEARSLGMAAGLKNVPDLVGELVDHLDFAIVEDCHHDGTCDAYRPFVDRGKAVFDAEYLVQPADFCAPTRAAGISAIAKHTSLGVWRGTCGRAGARP